MTKKQIILIYSLVKHLLKSSSVFSAGSSSVILSMKSLSRDVSSTNCSRPSASGCSSTQMWGRLFDFNLSTATASSAASSVMERGAGRWELVWFGGVGISMLISGSPGQKEIWLTPAEGERKLKGRFQSSGLCWCTLMPNKSEWW